MNEKKVTINYLNDDVIDKYASVTLREYRDINLKVKRYYAPYPNGVLDPEVFGSLFDHKCNCGSTRVVGVTCPRCGAKILDNVQKYSRYAKIELPVYYCSHLKFQKVLEFVRENFTINLDIESSEFDSNRGKDFVMIFDICQFTYFPDDNILKISDSIDDVNNCSYEGLIRIVKEHKPDKLSELMTLINHQVLVIPLALRPVKIAYTTEGKKLAISELTTVYQNIIYASEVFYKDAASQYTSDEELAILRGNIRCFVRESLNKLSSLMQPSKANFARNMLSNRIDNSGRCTIVPNPSLRIDEVELPISLVYEACREEFAEFLIRETGCSETRAEHIVNFEFDAESTQSLFGLYVEGNGTSDYPGKYAMINRAPTLHEYNLMAMKVHLTQAPTMSIPIAVCKAFNADFDGDAMTWYMIPDKSQDYIVNKMSPSKMLFYKNTQTPIFLPTQEVIQGLIIATKVAFTQEQLEFNSLEEALNYRRENKKTFKYQTLCNIEGQATTTARKYLSKLFDIDLEEYLQGFKNTITSKNLVPLYENITQLEDRIERIKEIQEFSLRIVTMTGVTSLKLSDIHSDLDEESFAQIKEIEGRKDIPDQTKEIKIRELYSTYVKNNLDKINDDIKQELKESSRADTSQLIDMINPRLTSSPFGELHVGNSTLIQGMNQTDYEKLAIENRGIQDIKQDGVPAGGYFTRQMVFLAGMYKYTDQEFPDNPGILLEESHAEGRTLVDGGIVGKTNSNKLVRVRSIITAPYTDTVIAKDMISNKISYTEGSKIGIALITSFSQGLTQGMLALKHGGNLITLDPSNALVVDYDVVKVLETDLTIQLTDTRGFVKVYPKPSSWVGNLIPEEGLKAGSIIGYQYHPITPSYKLDSFIKLSKARKIVPSKKFERNSIEESVCYAIEDGVIRYDFEHNSVRIGSHSYPYYPDSLYFYPEGTVIKKYQRFCSGLAIMDYYLENIADLVEAYYYFRLQVRELAGSIVDEIIEFYYTLIIKKNKQGKLVNRGIINSIHESNSFVTRVAFENAGKAFKALDPAGTQISNDDVFGKSSLPLMLNATLDLDALDI